MDNIDEIIIDNVIADIPKSPVIKMDKKEKPRTTPVRSSPFTPKMEKLNLVKIPEFKSTIKKEIDSSIKETITEPVNISIPPIPVTTPVIQEPAPVPVSVPTPVKSEKKEIKSPRVKLSAAENTIHQIRSNIPKYSEMSLEEQKKCREKFKAQYLILKDSWKSQDVIEITDTMPLEEIHEKYEYYVKNIHVSQSTDKYKVYMVIMWLFIEYGCVQIGLNVSGYTMSQMKSMSKYERLLIELGEKNYKYAPMGDINSEWPVEFNIVFMALANAAIFIIIKMLCEKINIGDGMANTIIETMSSYLSGAQPQPGNVLFGGTHKDISDIPQNNPMANLDLPSIISGLGNMFMQKPSEGKTPKFKPVYDD